MKKRLLALLLVFVMVLGMFPVTAMATGTTASTDGVVYISASHDGKYLDIPNNGGKLAYVAVNLSDLAKIKLADYDMETLKYDSTGGSGEEITALHLFIYVHTVLLGKQWSTVSVDKKPGSVFFNKGLFGYSDQNLLYYVNGAYPLQKDEEGNPTTMGATADQIVLASGDFVDVVHYTSWNFRSDPNNGFQYFTNYGDITHGYQTKAGTELTVTLERLKEGAAARVAVSPTTYVDATQNAMPIYYGKTAFVDSSATKVYPNSDGQAKITFQEAGTYYLWADGGYGKIDDVTTGYVVSSPAYAVVTVKEAADTTCTVTLPTGEGYTAATVSGYTTTVTKGGEFKFTVTLTDGYKKGAGFAVKVGEIALTPDSDGVYTLSDVQTNVTITVEGVEKETATSTAWDGTAKTEPKQVDGVYQISTGAELAWFVENYENRKSKDGPISGKLTADIDLNGYEWVSKSTSSNVAIQLDGDGHQVSGLNSKLGLLGGMSKSESVIKNLTVRGKVENTSGDILGGIIAKASNGTIENCVNYVNVTGKRRVGGITGYNANVNAKILNCANYGTIKATEDCAGGIVGHMYTGMTITGCYNAGTVSGKKLVGGLVGGSPDAYKKIEKISNPATITGCYNIGTITGEEYVGGLMGHATGKSSEECTKVTDCYSAGTITGTTNVGALFGLVYGEGDPTEPFATIETTYYLNTATDSYGTAKTEAELKSADGMNPTYFRSSCGGYPALVWQTDDNHASDGTGVVTEVTCTSAGYTTYTCTVCKKSYKDNWTPALGHDFCDHDVTQTCTSCAAVSGILVRACKREGCEATKEETIPTFHTVTLPTGTGYTVAAKDGASTTVTEGSSFSFTVTIAADYKAGDDFAVKTNGQPLTATDKVYTIENITADQTITVDGVVAKTDAEKKGFTVVAPAGSTITAGRFSEYYQYDFAKPLETGSKEDGSVYAIFEAGKSLQSFYRVQNPNGVTYWEFAKDGSQVFGAGETYTVTAEMLHLNDEDFTKKTVYTDYSQNIHDKADIYLNINEKGYINLDVGATKELNVFRNWMSLDDTTRNTGAALPDVTYTVVPLDGTDVVTITPGTNNSCVATLTANSQGTAIVLVTYDAMTNAHADGGSRFSAIWPENTGVFVVSVGKDGSGITTNMTVNETVNTAYSKTALDAEHDILFYVGNAGASYSFKPEDGCDVTLAHGTISDGKLTFGSFVKTGVSTATDGTVTLSGLTTGAHIVKVEKGGVATYQVIRARQVSYTITDAEGKTIDQSNPAEPGETVKIAFNGLISPMEKLSGVYNANYGFYYNGEKGVEVRTSTGYYGDYDYNRSSSKTPFSVTIPEDWNAATYTLTDGAIRIGGYGSFAGAHRTQRYVPTATKTDAEDVNGVLGVLPDIQIPTVYEAEKITVTLPTGAGYTVVPETGSTSPVAAGGSYSFKVNIASGYEATSLVVKANDTPLTAVDGVYTISNIQANQTITVSGVTKTPGETHTVTFQVKKDNAWNSYVTALKIYTYTAEDGKGTEITLGDKADGLYTVTLEEGSYWVEGYDMNEAYLGAMMLEVAGDAAYTIKHVAKIEAKNSGWTFGTDYTVEVTISGPGGNNRKTELGSRSGEGNTCIYADGDTLTAVFTPTKEGFSGDAITKTETPSKGSSYANSLLQCEFVPSYDITVTAPAGSTISAGYLSDYYIYEFVEPQSSEDGQAVYRLRQAKGSNIYSGMTYHFVRVQHPNGVTYWTFGQWNESQTIAVTADNLHLNDTNVTKSTVYANYEKNPLDLANIYLSVNEKNFLTLEQGKTQEINVWRTWQAIESINNAEIALPDVHYTILTQDGTVDTSNSVISITPDANNSSQAIVKAEGAGTAIVLVTYDTVTHANAMVTTTGNTSAEKGESTFSAIWPENTGVFVVTVGEDAEITTNMTMDRPSTDKTTNLDAEMDIFYYTGTQGAAYSFKPEEGCTVQVARSSSSGGKMTFSGFTTTGVTTAENGTVTVSGLTTGRHIIQVTKGGKSVYQVITARQTSYTVKHEDGTDVTAENPAVPNEKVTIQFTGLINPVEKVAGIYNNTTYLYYEDTDDTSHVSGSVFSGGTYDFNSNADKQKIVVTIPRYLESTSYTLVGSMTSGGYGATPGGHRDYRYGTKGSNNQNRPSTGGDISTLPAITIATQAVVRKDIQLVLKDGEQTVALTGLNIRVLDADGTAMTVNAEGSMQIPAGDYTYTISGSGVRAASGSFTVTAESTEIVIAVTKASEATWDGSTETEPTKVEDVYQISTGAELAWFVKKAAEGKEAISGALTADIDLGDYAWPYKTNTDPSVATKLDGQKHIVSGLSGSNSLLSRIGSGSEIKNLTVRGTLISSGTLGGIVGRAKDAVIENCVSEVKISGTGSVYGGIVGDVTSVTIRNCVNKGEIAPTEGGSMAKVGGIVGNVTQNYDSTTRKYIGFVKIENCRNEANLSSGTGEYAGGLLGYINTYADESSMTGSFNTGTISGKNNVGGLIGMAVAKMKLSDCYNTGTISSTGDYVGGIAGVFSGYYSSGFMGVTEAPASAANCYSIGQGAKKALFGFVTNSTVTTFTNCVYLNSLNADDNGTAKTEAELKQFAPEGSLFVEVCGGYPALNWETGKKTHKFCDHVVTETCAHCTYDPAATTEAVGTLKRTCQNGCGCVKTEEVPKLSTEETLTWQQAMEKTQKYLINQGKNEAPTVGSQSGEWLILGLARNGVSESFFNSYYNNVVSYVKENIDSNERLHETASTDNSRVILALTAMGKDVTNVGGHNLLKGLSSMDYLKKQGFNGPIWALIALDSGDYADPSAEVTRETLINYILKMQIETGGWGLDFTTPDDMTPMAIQALAPYYDNDHPAVKTAVDKALTVMKGMVPTTNNAESFSQIVVALCALGIDCETEPGFETVLDSLLTFALKTGGFKRDGSVNQMSTEQGFYALVAYNRLKQNKTRLYDMTDVVMKGAYSITVKSTTNGAVTVSTPKAVAGTTVTITVEPDLRYELDTLTVKTENGVELPVTDNKFTMPKANVTVEVTFKLNDHQAQDVMDAIDDLDVRKANAETQVALEALEAAYDALSEADKAKVTNYSQLRRLRNKFDELLDKAKKNAYEDVEDLLEDLDEKDYTEDNWKLILELMEQARKDIEKAKNTDELDDILDILKWDLDDIADGEDITVTFRLIGDFLHDSASAHEEYVTWIPTTTYTLEPGATVYDVFMEAMNDYGLNQKGASNNYVSTIQAPEVLGGYWLGEFDNGQNSGWMYTVNGSHPNVGLKACELQDGDRIIWHYVDDYTVEEYKFTWLEAEDISPEEYVKKHQKDVEFSDVSKNDWFYEDVQFVVKEGLFNGTGNSTFSPNASMTRAMLVTVLYRLEGEPKVTGASEFDDVAANQWYTNAVVWAAKHDIVGGYGDGKFGTNDSITREQMATILYRYAQYKKYDTKAANSLTGYSDFTSISAFALKGLKWANAEGLITGRTTTTLAPQGTATRAEVAAILHRFVENVKG